MYSLLCYVYFYLLCKHVVTINRHYHMHMQAACTLESNIIFSTINKCTLLSMTDTAKYSNDLCYFYLEFWYQLCKSCKYLRHYLKFVYNCMRNFTLLLLRAFIVQLGNIAKDFKFCKCFIISYAKILHLQTKTMLASGHTDF